MIISGVNDLIQGLPATAHIYTNYRMPQLMNASMVSSGLLDQWLSAVNEAIFLCSDAINTEQLQTVYTL